MIIPDSFKDTLVWSDELGYGFHTRPAMDYETSYFNSYQLRDRSVVGRLLTEARVNMVREYYDGVVCDIGIGGGRFVEEIDGVGFDVCNVAVDWLKAGGRYWNPYDQGCEAITCWDSLEHIPEPEKLLAKVEKFVFVSMPIYSDMKACLKSKHYKPGEHLHYFTVRGLKLFMRQNGFDLVSSSAIESDLGREGIMSFVFVRKV